MKTLIINILTLILLTGFHIPTNAQVLTKDLDKLKLAKIEPYQMQVTYNKTTHLIFPSGIKYVDLGSNYLIADKVEDAKNVLRVKASVRDFTEPTNFSVITDDGRFYNFDVMYNCAPSIMNYDLLSMQKSIHRENSKDVLLEDLGDNSPSLVQLLLERIYKNDKRIIKHIGSKSYGIEFLLKGIYCQNGQFYFHTQIHNQSPIGFEIDFINFKIVDKAIAKRTVIQEKPIQALRIYKPLTTLTSKSKDHNIFLLKQFTISDDKVLLVELFEKNGSRHQVFQIENSDLVNARLISEMHIEF